MELIDTSTHLIWKLINYAEAFKLVSALELTESSSIELNLNNFIGLKIFIDRRNYVFPFTEHKQKFIKHKK